MIFSRPLDSTHTHTHIHTHTHAHAHTHTSSFNPSYTQCKDKHTLSALDTQTHVYHTTLRHHGLSHTVSLSLHIALYTHTDKRKLNASAHGQKHSFCLLTSRLPISVYLTECQVSPSLSLPLSLSPAVISPQENTAGLQLFSLSFHFLSPSPPFSSTSLSPSQLRCHDDILL